VNEILKRLDTIIELLIELLREVRDNPGRDEARLLQMEADDGKATALPGIFFDYAEAKESQ